MPGGVRTEIHLDSQATAGAFCLLVDYPGVGWSLPAHLHRDAAETIHVIEGEFGMTIADRRLTLGPGQTVHVPAGVVHSGVNTGAAPGRRILIFSPGGMENFFLEAGGSSQDADVDLGAVVAAATRHGWEFTP
jgi:mannose-6-phosphate isomerase-like protein (cupin superfamily)